MWESLWDRGWPGGAGLVAEPPVVARSTPPAVGAAPTPVPRPLRPPLVGERGPVRVRHAAVDRDELARVAAGCVEVGSTVALDDSEIALAMVPHLLRVERLVIVTNAMRVATVVASRVERTGAELVLLPGLWDARRLAQLRVDRCFLSVASVSATHGACHDDRAMADVRRAMADIAAERVLLVEDGALQGHAQHHVAALATFDLAVMSAAVPAADVAAVRLAGPIVVTAPTSEPAAHRGNGLPDPNHHQAGQGASRA